MITHASTAATQEARFPGDEPLDVRGLRTASAASMPRRFDGVLRGPELRCAQTASAVGLDAVADPALADLDLGAWRGRTLTELEPDLGAWPTDPAAAPHGGESLTALAERVASWLLGLPGERSLLAAVTHPAVVRAAVLHTLGAPLTGFWRLDSAPLTQTWLTRHGGRWQVRETGHRLGGRDTSS
ncbi:histidine phosphatase family protein [Actinomadura sp. DC4]|uniref:histidine phosphatase family protein n=1 Tax=Actinomadura sp. DC4 TaxID=3055069 RepID=UPI0025B10B13|nr:histidine phosphatase family protein [Actinomadura sp. DC4]MDN3358797.1 histidine phosphatase family protein [Actinomadura sp. DC4]